MIKMDRVRIKLPLILAVILFGMNQPTVAEGLLVEKPTETVTANFSSTQTVICNLKRVSGQCREYTVLGGASGTLRDLKDGCVSMGGELGASGCPVKRLIAQCTDIVRNYKKPDTIYDAFYYSGESNNLIMDDVQRVCNDLGGEFLESPGD